MGTGSKQEKLRQQILELVGQYAREEFESEKSFIPGETHIQWIFWKFREFPGKFESFREFAG